MKNKCGKRLSYNARIFRGMKCAGETPLADDVQNTRREARDSYFDATNRDGQRRSIEDSLEAIDELASFIPDKTDCDPQVYFLYELSSLIGWAYSTMRFCGFVGDLHTHFGDLKELFRRILPAIPSDHEYRYNAILRFSQLCLEYAEMADEEAVNWCRIAQEELAFIIARKESELIERRNRMQEEYELESEIRRLRDVQQRTQQNVEMIQTAWSVRLPIGKLAEKLV